jgi:DNA replication and repair protein RecF
MSFDLIRVGNFRNLTQCEIFPQSGINIFFGNNASGKSSFLEALYVLGRGRSFRDSQLANLIQNNQRAFTVFARQRSKERKASIGIEYSKSGFRAHLNGEPIKRLSELAERTPIQIIAPNTLEVVEKGSQNRRSLMDWGVFHVEHAFGNLSSRYSRVLAQRNADLKNSYTTSEIWIPELVTLGNAIDSARRSYISQLETIYREMSVRIGIEQIPALELYSGWNRRQTLEESITASFVQDKKRGFTSVGPHRADILFKDENGLLKKWGSRGQIKMTLIALLLAQRDVLQHKMKMSSVLLLDDLAAELDETNLERIYQVLYAAPQQVFITTVDRQRYKKVHTDSWFHVEHGSISKVSV